MTGQSRKSNTQGSRPRQNRARVEATPTPGSDAPELDDRVLELARAAALRVRGRTATLRHGFVRLPRGGAEERADDEVPPLARILRGSRGGMRLKLYLTVLWMAGGGTRGHTASFPARAYAELLGLDDPEHNGQRRVREAFSAFADERLLTLRDHPGHPKTVVLLREDGSGEDYDRPGPHFDKAGDGADADPEAAGANAVHHFVQLRPVFWTEGWIQVLSAPAIAVLLAMMIVTTNGKRTNQWVSGSERRLYGLSDDTWTRGTAELVEHGILAVRRVPVSKDPFDFKRRRNTYSLILERLDRRPGEDADAEDADAEDADAEDAVTEDVGAEATPEPQADSGGNASTSRRKSTATARRRATRKRATS